ncbi:group II truncated hemoglobin [Streptomyces sp. VRA16 Mangrove soil]|uniref:group II truncated hemoglobin n=1 Tax=Streptomyces sp. VRA16 Mangrove soil TaxID=2817434 RepID=UPI001A9E6510|nr:antibiotic biosynthesis monooxygenase [Streptomyces sp. VRA16 Mangrove soil]MBO1334733.1 antibiotic biosynthesis monooxygenase [Streptomyces sp. VRA16 Mangrove soil]
MTTQTVEYIRYRIPEDRSAEFLAAYTRAARQLAASEHCVSYELARCEEDFAHYVLRIVWTSTEDHLEGFRQSELFPGFLAEIRPYVGAIDEMRHYKPTTVRGLGAAEPTLYEWAGGAEALGRLTAVFYAHVVKDDLLGPLFAELPAEHAEHVALWLGEVLGGPPAYSEQVGGHSHMVARHIGKGITEAQRRRWVNLMHDAADEAGLPTDAEFRSAFAAYVEWGTRLAVTFSAPGADRPDEQPVPVWGWGAAPPYRA